MKPRRYIKFQDIAWGRTAHTFSIHPWCARRSYCPALSAHIYKAKMSGEYCTVLRNMRWSAAWRRVYCLLYAVGATWCTFFYFENFELYCVNLAHQTSKSINVQDMWLLTRFYTCNRVNHIREEYYMNAYNVICICIYYPTLKLVTFIQFLGDFKDFFFRFHQILIKFRYYM